VRYYCANRHKTPQIPQNFDIMLSPKREIQLKCSNSSLCCIPSQQPTSTPLLSSLLNVFNLLPSWHSLEILKTKTTVHITHKVSVSTSSRIGCVSIMKTDWFVLCKEMFTDYYDNQWAG